MAEQIFDAIRIWRELNNKSYFRLDLKINVYNNAIKSAINARSLYTFSNLPNIVPSSPTDQTQLRNAH